LYASVLQYSGKISFAFTLQDWEKFNVEVYGRMDSIDKQIESEGRTATMIEKELILEDSFKDAIRTESANLTAYQILSSIPKRIAYLWSTADAAPPEIYNNYYHRISQLYYLGITILTIFGIFLRRSHLRQDWILLFPAIYITFIHLIFHVEARYSIPARPFLLIFAAVGISWVLVKLKLVSKAD
jgi:hypothetical protein